MNEKKEAKTALIQHKLRPEVKQWIERQAKEQERSQGWIANKIMEDAFAKAKQPQGVAA